MTVEGDQVVFGGGMMQKRPLPRSLRLPQAGEERRRIVIGAEALDQARARAPGWDKYYLEGAYKEFFADKELANEDARFLAWAPSFVKGRKP